MLQTGYRTAANQRCLAAMQALLCCSCCQGSMLVWYCSYCLSRFADAMHGSALQCLTGFHHLPTHPWLRHLCQLVVKVIRIQHMSETETRHCANILRTAAPHPPTPLAAPSLPDRSQSHQNTTYVINRRTATLCRDTADGCCSPPNTPGCAIFASYFVKVIAHATTCYSCPQAPGLVMANAVVHVVQGTVLSECPHLLTPLVEEAVWLYQLLLSATGVIL
jgi:hypothetical protein